jgi:DNA-binding beta-propeller fold protein YncE
VVDTLWRVGGENDHGGVTFGSVVGSAVDRLGRVFVGDYRMQLVHVLDTAGNMLRTVGRAGGGPGEFRLPSRVAVAPDGALAVVDEYWGRVVEFDQELAFVRTIELRPKLDIRTMLATADHFIFSGVESGSRGGTSTIHIYSRTTGERVRSFGTWNRTTAPELSRMVGAGALQADPSGGWWIATPGPYAIQFFSAEGEPRATITRTNRFLPPAEEGYAVSVTDGRMTFQYRRQAVTSGLRLTRRGTLMHQVRLDPLTVVTDEYAIDRSGPVPQLSLLHSWQGVGMPVLGQEIGPDLYIVHTRDEYLTSGIALVRLRPVAR